LRRRTILKTSHVAPAIVFLAPLIIYSITLTAGFVYDDNVQIITNPWIRDPGRIPDLFVSSTMSFIPGGTANTYRPVFYIIYMAEYLAFGLRAGARHILNIVIHSMNALAVYFLAALFIRDRAQARVERGETTAASPEEEKRWTIGGPLLAGLVFGLHPVNSEVACWVGAIPELVFTLMVLAAFILYLLTSDSTKKHPLYTAASLASFTVALFSKETAMALIIIIPLYELTRHGRKCLRRWKVFALYLLPAIIYMIMRTYALGGVTQMSLMKMTFYEGLLNVLPLIARYLGKLLVPAGLTIIYSFEPVHSALEFMFIIGVIACSLFAALIYSLRRRKDEVFFLLWILVPLLPVLYMPILSVGGFAERYLYLSTVGLACFAGLLVSRLPRWQRWDKNKAALLIPLVVIVLLAYSGASLKRAFVWRNDYNLWNDTIKKSPHSPNVLYNLAWTLHKRGGPGDKDRALGLYEEALRIQPAKEEAHYNAALIYQERDEYEKALEHFSASARLKPNSSTTYYNMAMILQAEGRLSRAIELYEQALRVDPANEDAHYNLAWAYQERGNYGKAVLHYRKVLRINPRSADAHYNMGVIYEEEGLARRALGEFQKALSIDPGYGPAILGMKRLKHGAS